MTAGYRLLAGAAMCALALIASRRPRIATALYAAGLTLLASTVA